MNLASDSANCNSCGSYSACVGARCVCMTGYADCDEFVGCEADLSTVATCGTCQNPCSNTGGTPSCVDGVCAIACDADRGDCDLDLGNGCETSTTSEPTCGACGVVCSDVGGTSQCVSSQCEIACSSGFEDCDLDPLNGCEDLSSPATCGACDTPCPVDQNVALATCTSGVCSFTCDGTWRDCDQLRANGCEVDIDSSIDHCGQCDYPCAGANGSPPCTAGACVP